LGRAKVECANPPRAATRDTRRTNQFAETETKRFCFRAAQQQSNSPFLRGNIHCYYSYLTLPYYLRSVVDNNMTTVINNNNNNNTNSSSSSAVRAEELLVVGVGDISIKKIKADPLTYKAFYAQLERHFDFDSLLDGVKSRSAERGGSMGPPLASASAAPRRRLAQKQPCRAIVAAHAAAQAAAAAAAEKQSQVSQSQVSQQVVSVAAAAAAAAAAYVEAPSTPVSAGAGGGGGGEDAASAATRECIRRLQEQVDEHARYMSYHEARMVRADAELAAAQVRRDLVCGESRAKLDARLAQAAALDATRAAIHALQLLL
jgi:hypothetical protein